MTETIRCLAYWNNDDFDVLETKTQKIRCLIDFVQNLFDEYENRPLYNEFMRPYELDLNSPPIFGSDEPDAIIQWAETMQQRVCKDAWKTITENLPTLETHDFNQIKEKASILADAFGLIASRQTDACNELFITKSPELYPWPDKYDLESIREDPSHWVICWITFKSN